MIDSRAEHGSTRSQDGRSASLGVSVLLCATIFVVLLTAVSQGLLAVSPHGDEFQVNTHWLAKEPAIGLDANGDMVIVWQQSKVTGRRFDSDGSPLSENFQPGGDLSVNSSNGTVDVGQSGEFVVSFAADFQYPSYPWIRATLYPPNSDGSATGHTWVDLDEGPADSAISAQGSFVVAWGWRGYYSKGISVRRWDSTMQPVSGELTVTDSSSPSVFRPDVAVAMSPIGEFVVVWEEEDDGSGMGVMARCFDPADTARGPTFPITQETLGDQVAPDVAIDTSGRFLVTWTSPDTHGTGIFGRRFEPDGSPLGDEFLVNSEITGNQARSAVAMDSRGAFVVAWQSNVQDGDGYGVFLQAFRPDGSRDPDSPVETQVNQTVAGNQYLPSVDLSEGGVIGVAWQDDSQHWPQVMARVFDAAALAPLIFSDGFESGDTSAWNATVN